MGNNAVWLFDNGKWVLTGISTLSAQAKLTVVLVDSSKEFGKKRP